MGYVRGLRHGAIAGAILALLYAPRLGLNTRPRVSRLLGQAEAMLSADNGGPRPTATPRRERQAEQKIARSAAIGRTTMDQTVEKTVDRLASCSIGPTRRPRISR